MNNEAVTLNGVDLLARQSLAEQVREDSWEAQLRIGMEARATAPGRYRVGTEPMRLGSTRVARPFEADYVDVADAGHLDPVGSVLLFLGASVVDTVVTALTLEGCSPLAVVVHVTAGPDGDGSSSDGRGTRLGYQLRLDGAITAAQARAAAAWARVRDPAHRTLADGAEIRAVVRAGSSDIHLDSQPAGDGGQPADPADPAGSGPAGADPAGDGSAPARAAQVVWEVGTHVLAEVGDARVTCDQPKQLFGADLAFSPQEYLLAALACEALGFARAGGQPNAPAVAHAAGRLDLRGPYTTLDAPVGLRDVLVQLLPESLDEVPAPEAESAAADAVRRWFDHGEALRLVRDARPIDVTILLNGAPVDTGEAATIDG
jgi:hypothetical protein